MYCRAVKISVICSLTLGNKYNLDTSLISHSKSWMTYCIDAMLNNYACTIMSMVTCSMAYVLVISLSIIQALNSVPNKQTICNKFLMELHKNKWFFAILLMVTWTYVETHFAYFSTNSFQSSSLLVVMQFSPILLHAKLAAYTWVFLHAIWYVCYTTNYWNAIHYLCFKTWPNERKTRFKDICLINKHKSIRII